MDVAGFTRYGREGNASMMVYTVTARNPAAESENKIHDDTVARRYGFRGGLVPGVVLFGYLAHPVARVWGRRWLAGGRIDTRFVAPVYDGEQVTATVADDGAVTLAGPSGQTCVTGRAARDDDQQNSGPDVPAAPLPERRPPASAASLVPGTVLGSVERRYDAETAAAYLDQLGDGLQVFRAEGLAHPGWLLSSANEILVANVALGPWIHTESRVRFLQPVRVGQAVQTRARVAGLADRRGHRFVELDVAVYADGRTALTARHVAIYEPRPAG
ncbi:MAG: hypothetical protein GEV03_14790 [Streptosporangiales bacterium]|nr:hypothetical protein [Streptosporangiales bacterium]